MAHLRATSRRLPPGLTHQPITGFLLTLLLLFCSASAFSQGKSADSMPPWAVLALKLVSATHVQPTTGIVIGAPDRVLVPIDFAREGDEIMVLDGGTDIVRHGRPATIVHTLPADKLAVLKVQGLNRPAVKLSAASLADLKSLALVAFPPAEQIAQGAAPVRADVKTLAAISDDRPTLDPFPNVSGALTDACGNLVAYSLPTGVQSMEPAGSPRVVWADGLKRAATMAGVTLQQANCAPAFTGEEPATLAAEVPQQSAETPATASMPEANVPAEDAVEAPTGDYGLEPQETDAGNPPPEAGTGAEEPESEIGAEEPEAEIAGGLVNPDTTVEDSAGSGEAVSDGAGAPRRLLLTGVILGSLALLLLLAWRLSKRRNSSRASESAMLSPAPASDEPRTVRFENAASAAKVVLNISGQRSDGEAIRIQLPVSGPGWMAELGRQEADADLGSATVSRHHTRLQLHEGRITVTDLDSTNGTRLNGVACLPGEVFFVGAEDSLQLGEVTVSLQLAVDDERAV